MQASGRRSFATSMPSKLNVGPEEWHGAVRLMYEYEAVKTKTVHETESESVSAGLLYDLDNM